MSVLIKNGLVITAERSFVEDIYIEKDKISALGVNLSFSADRIIDAKNKYVIPGGIDVHTHLDMPLWNIFSSDDFETGTKAAAFGGTTTIVDFATQSKGMKMQEALDIWHRKADGKACIDYGFHMIITDLSGSHINGIDEMIKEGVTSFKLFMAYPGTLMIDDAKILRVMKRTADKGGLVCIHAEDGYAIDTLVRQAISQGCTTPIYHALTRPPITEGNAVGRSIDLAVTAKVPVYIVHLSSNDGLQKIIAAQKKGLPIFAETCPQYLFLSQDLLELENFEGAKYVFTPPPREKWHQEKLWEGLKNNALQVVATDHCPFNFSGQKDIGKDDFTKIPNGGPGIENRLQLLFEGGVNQKRISVNRWVEITSTAPAKIFSLYPRKGVIEVGSDADIVIWDPKIKHTISAETHHMRVDYSMYEGLKIRGNAEIVLLRGEIIVEKGCWIGNIGRGRYIKRFPMGINF